MAGQGASPPAAAACHMSPPPPHLCSKPHHPTRPAAATFCFPSKGSLQLGAMSFRLSLHHLFSPLLRRLCSCLLPSLPVPLPRACSHSPVGCAGRGAWASQKWVSPRGGMLCQALGPAPTRAPPFHAPAAPPRMVQEHGELCAGSCHGAVSLCRHRSQICFFAWSQGSHQASLGDLSCTQWHNQACHGGGCLPTPARPCSGSSWEQDLAPMTFMHGPVCSASVATVVVGDLTGATR